MAQRKVRILALTTSADYNVIVTARFGTWITFLGVGGFLLRGSQLFGSCSFHTRAFPYLLRTCHLRSKGVTETGSLVSEVMIAWSGGEKERRKLGTRGKLGDELGIAGELEERALELRGPRPKRARRKSPHSKVAEATAACSGGENKRRKL